MPNAVDLVIAPEASERQPQALSPALRTAYQRRPPPTVGISPSLRRAAIAA
jgi:hypothetical protein